MNYKPNNTESSSSDEKSREFSEKEQSEWSDSIDGEILRKTPMSSVLLKFDSK